MNYLKHLSAYLARRVLVPLYWEDFLREELRRRGVQDGINIISGTALALLTNVQLDRQIAIPGLNIVTTNGDRYYAEMAVNGTPTIDFNGVNAGLRHGSASTSPTKSDNDVTTFLAGTGHAVDATYPRTADPDGNNTGSGVDIATWRYSYTTAEGNTTGIREGAHVNNRTSPTSALSHFLYAAAFDKTSSDTLVTYLNHDFTGT